MMTSQASKYHDPMYNFDTHFPERLSRIHLHNESPVSFRKRKSRAQRCGSRYKTQPVTFDEITEVDEEPSNAGGDDKPQGEKLKGQLQAFSRSMDGLLPKTGHDHIHHHFSHSRSGSRKYHRHPACIPERVEAESATSPQPQTSHQQQLFAALLPVAARVPDATTSTTTTTTTTPNNNNNNNNNNNTNAALPASSVKNEEPSLASSSSSPAPSSMSSASVDPQAKSGTASGGPGSSAAAASVTDGVGPSNMAPRRQKVTAKAKKRQKASEEGQGPVS